MMDRRYVIQREGKDFALYAGLLDLAHERGLLSIETVLVQLPTEANGNIAVVQATVRLSDAQGVLRSFQGIGDAAPGNVNRMMAPHLLRLAECVPLRAEILTLDGWCRYHEVYADSMVLAYDVETDACRWVPLLGTTVYEAPQPVCRMQSRSFAVTVTPEHTWAVTFGGRRALRKTNELRPGDKIIVAAPAEGGAHPLTPRDAAVLGWVMTDGTLRWDGPYPRMHIDQSKEVYVPVIRELLGNDATEAVTRGGEGTFPTGRTYATREAHRFSLSAAYTRHLLETTGLKSPVDLPRLALLLSQPARAAMLNAMNCADGHNRGRTNTKKSRSWVFAKKRKPGAMETWELLATLEGHALGRAKVVAHDLPARTLRVNRFVAARYCTPQEAPPEAVWCPTTPLGTWVMRLDGCITITGNTRAKARALRDAVNVAEALADDPSDDAPEPSAAPRTDEREQRQAPEAHRSRPMRDAPPREWFVYLAALASDHGIAVPPTPGPGVTDEAIIAENKRLKAAIQAAQQARQGGE